MTLKMPSKMIPTYLYRWMLMAPHREYVAKEIKAPLMVGIINLAAEHPKPARSKGRWHVLLYRLMLWTIKRKYFAERVKKPLMAAIVSLPTLKRKKAALDEVARLIRLCNKYPEPTMDNTCIRNVAKLLNIRDEFLKLVDDPRERELFEAVWRMFIVEYEHDGYYRYRIDFILEEINKRGLSLSSLLVIQDKFFEYEDNSSRDALFRAIWKVFIRQYKQNPNHRHLIHWTFEELNKCEWEPRTLRREACWKEPESVKSRNKWVP